MSETMPVIIDVSSLLNHEVNQCFSCTLKHLGRPGYKVSGAPGFNILLILNWLHPMGRA